MPPALYNLKCRAIQERAYVHPGWDYLKYPAVELEVCYSNLTSNKMYDEELDEDGYPISRICGKMRFIIIVRGTRGYGVDYGENILYALKNFSTQWEDSILSVKIKGDFSN